MDEGAFPYKEIVDLMKFDYNLFGEMRFNLIDSLTDYLILRNVRCDKEFKLLLGEGYYK
jgi:hypothetical protein